MRTCCIEYHEFHFLCKKKDALAKRIFFNMYQCQYRWSAILTFQAQALLLPFLQLLQMLSRKFRFSYECV